MFGTATVILVFFVLIALGGFAFFIWREWIYFAQKTPKALLRVGAGLLCFIFTVPLLMLSFAPVLLAGISGALGALGRPRASLIMAALGVGALVYQILAGGAALL